MAHNSLGRAIDVVLWGLHNRVKDPDPTWQYETHWIYQRADGAELLVVVRSRNGAGEQVYRPIHKDGGRWFIRDPLGPLSLYRLTGLAGAGRIYLAEGEKVCDLAWSLGLVATASAHGAKAPHKADWLPLAGKEAIILADADPPVEAYAVTVTAILASLDPRSMVKIHASGRSGGRTP
jgi:hypothetical protein